VKRVEPDVPRDALGAGTPILRARISEKGDVVDVEVVRSVGRSVDKYYVDALRQWKYKPGTLDGKPVATDMTVTMMIRPQ
jgi:TonB family protein